MYALLGVHVIAVFQVLIYVGAVMVFMVYAIMLLDVRDRAFTRRFSGLVVPGNRRCAAVPRDPRRTRCGALCRRVRMQRAPRARCSALRQFSIEFLNEYWLHFELVSVLLVAAVVAALAVLEVGRRRRG